jgi:riboflavin synthase
MFTGIVEELGTVRAITSNEGGARVEIECRQVLDDAQLGASIAVNGCCLTVVELGDGWWAADAQRETIDRTTLGGLRVGDRVNLERPVRLTDRLGGHVVQGHVDGVGTVASREPLPDGSTLVRIAAAPAILRYAVEKGSITVDGVSLTITTLEDTDATFGVALVQHTLSVTTFGDRAVGARVNLEVDVLAKYVERLLPTSASASGTSP